MWDGGSMATVRALVGFCRPVAGVDDVGCDRWLVGLMAVELHQTRRSGVVLLVVLLLLRVACACGVLGGGELERKKGHKENTHTPAP